jgi:hypothetical protein
MKKKLSIWGLVSLLIWLPLLVIATLDLKKEIGFSGVGLTLAATLLAFGALWAFDRYFSGRKSQQWMTACYVAIALAFAAGVVVLMMTVL